jgi:hypothetical protein
MGAYKFDGVDDFALALSGLEINSYPMTIGVVFMAQDSIATMVLAGLFDDSEVSGYHVMQYQSSDDVAYRASQTGTGNSVSSTGAGAEDIWQTGVIVGVSAVSRSVFRDGGAKASTTTSRTWNTNIDSIGVGAFTNDTPGEYFDGWIGYVFIWNVDLSDAEVADFHNGILPQEDNLVHVFDFTSDQGNTIQDLINDADLTVNGAVYDDAVTPDPEFDLGGEPTDTDNFFAFV